MPDDPARAIERWSESVALLRALGERAFLGSVLIILAWGQVRAGDLATSRRNVLEGAGVTRDTGAIPDLAVAVVHIADWFVTAGSTEIGARHWRAAEAVRQSYGFNRAQIWPFEQVGKELERVNPELLTGPYVPDATVDAALDAAIVDLEAFVLPATRVAGSPIAVTRRAHPS